MNYILILVIFIVVYFASNIPNLEYYIDLPIIKFSVLGLIVCYANVNTKYALYITALYLFLYNIAVTKATKENFNTMEPFQQYDQMDSDAYNDSIEF